MSDKIYRSSFRPLFSLKGLALICLLGLAMFSCKKELTDVDTLQSKMGTGMVSYIQGSNVVSLNGVSYNFTPYFVGVPIKLKEEAKSDEIVTVTVDPNLVAQYNQLYLENNPAIPQGAFSVVQDGMFPISKGSSEAKDSLHVLLNDGSQLKDSTIYLVPVTLSSQKGSKLSYSVFFFKVFVTKGELQSKMFGSSVINGNTAARYFSGALGLVYSVVPDSVKFQVNLNTQFPAHDVSVQAVFLTDDEVNEGIITEQFYGYPEPIPVPMGIYTLTKDVVTVPARSLLSRDSLTVRFPNKADLPKDQWYVMGLKLKTYTGSQYGVPPVANDSARVYIRFFISN